MNARQQLDVKTEGAQPAHRLVSDPSTGSIYAIDMLKMTVRNVLVSRIPQGSSSPYKYY